jgi:hypothetical protein
VRAGDTWIALPLSWAKLTNAMSLPWPMNSVSLPCRKDGRLVTAQRGHRLEQHRLAGDRGFLGERVPQLRQQMHRGQRDDQQGHRQHRDGCHGEPGQ